MYSYQDYSNSAEFIKKRINNIPDVAIVLSPSLSAFVDGLNNRHDIHCKDIPSFPQQNAAQSDKWMLSFVRIGNRSVVIQSGNFHYYEGYAPEITAYPIRVYKILGIKTLICTCAVGGINKKFNRGDIVLITDHINFFGNSPLRGKNENEFGNRFVDMSQAYSKRLLTLSERYNSNLKKGIYAYMQGPNFETPAEIRALRALGADVVGMGMIPNVITAVHAGIEVMTISHITSMATGVNNQSPRSHDIASKADNQTFKIMTELLNFMIKMS